MALKTPKISQRVDKYYAEFFTTKGPEILADPQNQTFEQLYGYDWLTLVTDEGLIEIYQWNGSFWDSKISFSRSGDLQRLSLSFDQSANVIFAYELSGVIRVTRWDINTSAYVEDITFSGLTPVLYNDVFTNFYVGDSDVICFYTDGSTTLKQRFQRDDFGTEYSFTPDTPLPAGFIIDRVITLDYKWQVLASDSLGMPLELMPTSDRYPLYITVPSVEGQVGVGVNFRSIVKTYAATVPSISGSANVGVSMRSIVQTYNPTVPTAEGSIGIGVAITTIVTIYDPTVPTIEGSVSTGVTLTTVAEQYAPAVPTVAGSASTGVTLTTV